MVELPFRLTSHNRPGTRFSVKLMGEKRRARAKIESKRQLPARIELRFEDEFRVDFLAVRIRLRNEPKILHAERIDLHALHELLRLFVGLDPALERGDV